ncbi:hypothetical protein C8J56DRAFT_715027, partial [Mycena floridula]
HEKLLTDPRYQWSYDTCLELAKGTFRGFKRVYLRQPAVDPIRHAQSLRDQRSARRRARRNYKCDQLRAVTDKYVEKYPGSSNPAILLNPDLMSDDASGPSDDESKDDWKQRMAAIKLGVSNLPQKSLEAMHFLENVDPIWRSDELGAIFHDLAELAQTLKDPRHKNKYQQVTQTGRRTEKPPNYAPHNFGISPHWWDTYGPNGPYYDVYREIIEAGRWNQFPDPPGFGPNHTGT